MTRAVLARTSLLILAFAASSLANPSSAQQKSDFFEKGLGEISPEPSRRHQSAFERGEAAMSHRDFEGAISAFSEAIGFNMNNSDAYFKRGQCYYYQKNYQSALSDFEYMLKMTPASTQALLWSGTAHARLGHEEKAVNFYLRAMRTDPKLVTQYQEGNQAAAQPHSVNPNNEGAVSAYAKAVALYLGEGKSTDSGTATSPNTTGSNPGASPLSLEPTIIGCSGKRTHVQPPEWKRDSSLDVPYGEVDLLDAAIRENPKDAAAYFRRGLFNKHFSHKENALADFSEAILLDPTISRFYLARARLYHEQNQPELSQADVDKARSIDSTVPLHINFDETKVAK